MKLNKEQLEKLNYLNEFIIEWCDYFVDFKSDLIFPKETIEEIVKEEEDIDYIEYEFPGTDDLVEIDVEYLLELSDEINTIKILNNSCVKTNLRSCYVVGTSDTNEDYILRTYHDMKSVSNENYEIKLLDESFLVGLAATQLEEYEKDYWGTISQYLAIEIKYKNKESVLNEKEEKELLYSFLFEIAEITGIALSISEIRNPIYEFEELREEAEEQSFGELNELEPYNEGMKFFVSAVQIKEPELRFLNYYKVLEHFSPVAVNIEANELMRKKLDSPKSSFEDGDFIRSIFELANSMRDRFNDEDLIKASFSTCFDFVGLYKKLPISIKKRIKSHLGGQELNYSTEKQKITTSCNIAAKIIYKTRNKVVHAKSNFTLTGEEIDSEEIEQLNDFMRDACSQSIRWYSRQPNHLKLEIIK